MDVSDIVTASSVFVDLKPGSKKQLLQDLAIHAARHVNEDERKIFDVLLQRERLGSTGVGNGVAIPHGKLSKIDRIYGLFARLHKPIAFDAMDDQPVDIVFLLLAPEGSGAAHLKALSRVARLLRNPSRLAQIRASEDAETLFSVITANEDAHAA